MKLHTGILGALATAAAVVALAFPIAASAQSEQTVAGSVTAFDGHFDMHVKDAQGNDEHVRLHHGTIINPRGLTLSTGMEVRIIGPVENGVLEANEIDTPYNLDSETGGYYYYPGPSPFASFGSGPGADWYDSGWGWSALGLGLGLGYWGWDYPYYSYYAPVFVEPPGSVTPRRPVHPGVPPRGDIEPEDFGPTHFSMPSPPMTFRR
jgi:hypothetical protein